MKWRKKKRPIPDPPEQDIPKHIKKGDEVLYMLQRINYHHMVLVKAIVTSKSKEYEKFMLDLFKSDSIRMTPSLWAPNWFNRSQIKFGISKNLPRRLEDINNDIFDSGVTEWRALSWPSYIIAMFLFWWFDNKNTVYLIFFGLFLITTILIFITNS